MATASDKVASDVKSFLRSVLISSNGVKESKVERDYRELAGERLNWRMYGFASLREFLQAIPDACRLEYSAKDRENRVFAVEVKDIYMSTHALKNVKSAAPGVVESQLSKSTIEENNTSFGGRTVCEQGNSLKITIGDDRNNDDNLFPEVVPNDAGLYQVYVTKLPYGTTKEDLRKCFLQYGVVKEYDVIISSQKKKVGFIRYKLKSEAVRALTQSKSNLPPVIRGQQLDVGLPKSKKSNNVESSVKVFSNTEPPKANKKLLPPPLPSMMSSQLPSLMSSPLPSLMSSALPSVLGPTSNFSPHSNTLVPAVSPQEQTIPSQQSTPMPEYTQQSTQQYAPKQQQLPQPPPPNQTYLLDNSQQPGPVSDNEMLSSKPSSIGEDMNDLTGKHGVPLFIVNVGGYSKSITKDDLRKAIQVFGNIMELEYHPMYTIVKFKTQCEVNDVISGLNGKFLNGSVLVVSAVGQKKVVEQTSVLDEVQSPSVSLVNEEVQLSIIYSLHEDMVTRACGLSYQQWLDSLPDGFEVKFMDIIDPITFYVHIHDRTLMYQDYNDMVLRLQTISSSSNQQQIYKHEFGVGRFSGDGKCYRCYCFDISSNLKKVNVLYIDYGNTEWLDRDSVVPLPSAFLQLPPQGVLAQISGVTFKSDLVDNQTKLCSAQLFLYGGVFNARKGLSNPAKPKLLELELLDSEDVYNKLCSFPGIELIQRSTSPVELVLLTPPPLPPSELAPLKQGLDLRCTSIIYIWIVNITSPVTFHFQLSNQATTDVITEIRELLLKCDVQNKVSVRNIKKDELVCYHRNGYERSRVQLISSSRAPVPGQVAILHVDTGKEAMVPCSSFISLPSKAKTFPYQARPALLHNVSDDNLSQSLTIEFVVQNFKDQVLRANVVNELPDETVVVEVYNRDGESLNKKLTGIIQQNKNKHGQSIETRGQSQSGVLLHVYPTRIPETHFPSEDMQVTSQKPRGQAQDTRRQAQDLRGQTQDLRGQTQDSHGQTRDARGQTQDALGQTQDARGQTHVARGQTHVGQSRDPRGQTQDARGQTQDARGQAQDARGQAQDARVQIEDARGQTLVARCPSRDARVQIQDARGQIQDRCGQTQDARGQTQDARGQTQDARGQTQNARGQTQNARGQTHVARGQTHLARGQTQDARGQTQDARWTEKTAAPTQDTFVKPQAPLPETRALFHVKNAQTQDSNAFSHGPRVQSRDAVEHSHGILVQCMEERARSQDARAQTRNTHTQSKTAHAQTQPNHSMRTATERLHGRTVITQSDQTTTNPKGTRVDLRQIEHEQSQKTHAAAQEARKKGFVEHARITPEQRLDKNAPSNVPQLPHTDMKLPYSGQISPTRPSILSVDTTRNVSMTSRNVTSQGVKRVDGISPQMSNIPPNPLKNLKTVPKTNPPDEKPALPVVSEQSPRNQLPPAQPKQNNANVRTNPNLSTNKVSGKKSSVPTQTTQTQNKSKIEQNLGPAASVVVPSGATAKGKSSISKTKSPENPSGGKQRLEAKNDSPSQNDFKATKTKSSGQSWGYGVNTYSNNNNRIVSGKIFDRNDLLTNVAQQEKMLSKPAAEIRQLLVHRKVKEKLEVQIRIKTLENEILALKEGLKDLNREKEMLENELR